MEPVNIHDAKTQFSRLIDRVTEGHEVVIARAGRPVARLVPYVERRVPRKLGLMAGQFSVPDDFDAMDAGAILELFEGGPPAGT
ncbi:MAG: type II toxin-antitoxin system Phd/YefM family antitoxin [Burkholderiaceae bacterium]